MYYRMQDLLQLVEGSPNMILRRVSHFTSYEGNGKIPIGTTYALLTGNHGPARRGAERLWGNGGTGGIKLFAQQQQMLGDDAMQGEVEIWI